MPQRLELQNAEGSMEGLPVYELLNIGRRHPVQNDMGKHNGKARTAGEKVGSALINRAKKA